MKTISRFTGAVLFLALIVTTTFAQTEGNRPDPSVPQGKNFEVPEGWNFRPDYEDQDLVIGSNVDSSDIYFVNMTPGWHITSGPAGIYYHPANTADGSYTVHTSIFLFDPEGRNREAFGLFLGGKNLQADNQEYLYFLIRNTGEFLIKSRSGDETYVINEWAQSDAIQVYENGSEDSSVKNNLTISVNDETITFLVNGTEVKSLEAGEYKTDGVFGLRVNHALNIHISDLELSFKR